MSTHTYEPSPTNLGAATSPSAVSWAAIFAGALAAGVMSLLLFMLGAGLGLSSLSVWSGRGAEGSTLGWGALFWLVITQLFSAAIGGYLAGRLRTKWQGVHTDEVYFRDTAHGFLAWALATIGMVILAGSVLSSAISGVGKAAGAVASGTAAVVGGAANVVGGAVGTVGSVAGGAASAAISGVAGAATGQVASSDSDWSYWISSMMRNGGPTEAQKQQATDKIADVAGNVADKAGEAADHLSGSAADAAKTVQDTAEKIQRQAPDLPQKAQQAAAQARDAAADAKEVGMIFTQAIRTGQLPEQDAKYVARIVAQHTDVSEAEAQKKVEQTFADIQKNIEDAKQAAEKAKQEALEAAETARKATAHSMLWMFVVLLIGAFVGSLSATYGGRQRNNA